MRQIKIDNDCADVDYVLTAGRGLQCHKMEAHVGTNLPCQHYFGAHSTGYFRIVNKRAEARLRGIGHFGKYHNALCLSPQILRKHCFCFLLGLF